MPPPLPQPVDPNNPNEVSPQPSKKKYLLGAIVILLSLAISASIFVFHSKHSSAPTVTTKATTSSEAKNSKSKLSQNRANVLRKNDIAAIASAISEFMANNSGSLPLAVDAGSDPKVLAFCAAGCATETKAMVNLGFYSSGAVTLHPYDKSLKVPDTATVYVVDYAVCDASNTGIGNQAARTASILYTLQQDSGSQQHCFET